MNGKRIVRTAGGWALGMGGGNAFVFSVAYLLIGAPVCAYSPTCASFMGGLGVPIAIAGWGWLGAAAGVPIAIAGWFAAAAGLKMLRSVDQTPA